MIRKETISTLKKLLSESDISLVDVRELDEYANGHVPGAISLPLSHLEYTFDQLDKSKTHHIICLSGGRSARAAAFLEAKGYDVINVLGGTMAWTDKLEY